MSLVGRLRADASYVRGAWRALQATATIAKSPTRTFPLMMQELAERHGDAPALISDIERFSYRQLAARANRYARWAKAQGIAKGDTVCLLMPNRPEYMAAWLGLAQAGAVVALLNTRLSGKSLALCIDAVAPKHAIVAADLAEALAHALPHVGTDTRIWLHGAAAGGFPRIDHELESVADAPLRPDERPALSTEDRALYIFTSGTGGMPKPAIISHYRLMLACLGFASVMDATPADRMYNCLPMYHTAGGVVATGALLASGGSVVIRDRFSAHQFWDDVMRWDCTLFQYVGELCRYLVNAPPHPGERNHRLRLCCGNGLRPDVWPEFKRRFRIPEILEFYAATEGNVLLFNGDGKEGAIGRIPWFLARKFPVKLVRFDFEREAPAREERGRCIECAPGEIGEAIGRIVTDRSKPAARFDGYVAAADNTPKVIRDVFEAGDAWFRSGDLMRKDRDGYFYFVDRIGDTFRWKGENVSTLEVAQAITGFTGVVESTVYGVEIPRCEGRAGMAALVTDREVDLAHFHAFLRERLPAHARPLFLRMRGEIDVTSTFKHRKIELKNQGFDLTAISDPLWFNDPRAEAFVPLDQVLYNAIVTGEIRL